MFKPLKVIADEGNFGISFVQELKAAGVPIKGYKFQRRRDELLEVFRDAFDKNFTEQRDKDGKQIPLPFKERKFFINYGQKDTTSLKMIDILIEELLGFGVLFKTSGKGDMTGTTKFESVKKHDDMVMACALGWWACRSSLSGKIIVNRGSARKSSGIIFRT